MIQLKNVSKKLSGKQIAHAVSCEVKRGILHISGENGSGKSTLLNMMAGLLKPDDGQILYSGIDIYGQQDTLIKNNVGYCPSSVPVYDFLIGADFFKFICKVKNSPWPSELIDLLKLSPHLETNFASMSYGTKKKFLIIAALLDYPRYHLLDEPMNGIDQKSAQELFKLMTHYLEIEDSICVLVTHDESWLHDWQGQFNYQNINLSCSNCD